MLRPESTADVAMPLMEPQEGLWFAQALDPGNPIFNTCHYFELKGELDVVRFKAAVNQAFAEADSLALCFEETGSAVTQRIDPSRRPRLMVRDLTDAADPAGEALELITRDQQTALDLTRDALAATMLLRVGENRHWWSLRVHHLAADGYGMGLLASRVAELYAGREGKPLAPLSRVAEEDAAYRTSERRVADTAFWREAMAGVEEIGAVAPGRAVTAHRFHRLRRQLPEALVTRLRARAERAKISWPDLITALAGGYCRRFAGTEEAVVGVPWMGRMGSASARVPAMVMNALPLRIAFDERAPLDECLAELSRDLARSRRHGRYRSEQLRRDLGLIGGDRRLYGPLINVLPFDHDPKFTGLTVTTHVLCTGPVDDIDFTFRGDAAPSLSIEADANPDLYSLAEVEGHLARLEAFIDRALDADRLAQVGIATDAEAERELESFNRTAHPLPVTTLAELLEEQMREAGDAEALVFGDRRLTYRELDHATAALAAELQARGAGREMRVAVALPRSIELVVALLAVLRAGAAYLPLDLDHPPQRIATILGAAEPVLVLAQDDPHGLYGNRLLGTADWPKEGGAFRTNVAPDDAAYVIYTSGSTGAPKGVVIEHRAIVNRLLWMQAQYGIGPASRILQKTPATFDVSVWEFFLALISGGTLVVAPPEAHRDPAAIAALIREHGITDLHFVPSMLAAFLSAPEAARLEVAHVFVSGEALPPELRDRFHTTLSAELHNLYGPTEAAVDVSHWPASSDDSSRPVPIGWPVWNTRLVILDVHGHPVAPGMAGQLHLGGVQLARGYLGRADLTAERFIPDPYHPGERLYRTGDLARRRGDGAVLFLGRDDHQVKIRGLRIELGEIEAVIAESGLVRELAVIAREHRPGDKRIVAYVVPAQGFRADALRQVLAERLPGYMIPTAIIALDQLPVTANGKLDRKALPAPALDEATGRPVGSETEQALAALFAQVLGLATPPDAEADFFALGGDSLHAVELVTAIRARWGREIGLGTIFEAPRLEDLAARLDAEAMDADHGLGPVIRLAEGDRALPPLFVIHPAGGLCWGYRTLARALSPRRTVIGLQSPALDPAEALPESVDALADLYVERVREIAPEGPHHLLGWSVGGIIAQAMAVRLEAMDAPVGLLAMLDSYPSECWRDEPEPSETDALRALLAIAGHDPEAHPDLTTRAAIIAFLRGQGGPMGALPPQALDGVVRAVLDTNRLVRAHHHRPFGGVTTHVCAALDHAGTQLRPELWGPYAAELDVIEVPYLHSQLSGPSASEVIAPQIDARMRSVEGSR
jgi:enterobactin synthetase component F